MAVARRGGGDQESGSAEGKGETKTGDGGERVEGGCRTLQGILRPRHYGEQMSNSLNPRVL